LIMNRREKESKSGFNSHQNNYVLIH